MPPDGFDTISRWREAGEWWNYEPYRQIERRVNTLGILSEHITQAKSPASQFAGIENQSFVREDQKVDYQIRIKKLRDEKVKRAFGYKSDGELVVLTKAKQQSNFALLHTLSGYSFGKSTMLAEEIPGHCARYGIPAALLADTFSLTGVQEFTKMCAKAGIKPLIGATLEMETGGEIVLVAQTPRGFKNLSIIVTKCHLNQPRKHPLCLWEYLEGLTDDLICLTAGHRGVVNRLLIPRQFSRAKQCLEKLVSLFGILRVFVQVERTYQPWEISVNRNLLELAKELQVRAVAGGPITHAAMSHFCVQDILVCVESLCLIEEVTGRKPQRHEEQPQVTPWPQRHLNAENYIRPPNVYHELYADMPCLLANTMLIADACSENVLPSRTQLPKLYPDEEAVLRQVVHQGAIEHYRKLSPALHKRIQAELATVTRLGFAGHFLVAWDMCQWARNNHIVFSGRGSVIDSVLSYCLGFSRIDAHAHHLHFDRFLPSDGTKRPDIDIDFEAHRREDVRQYIVGKYGADRVSTVAAVGAYLTRGIIREVGKVMGLPEESIGYLAKRLHGSVSPAGLEEALQRRPELRGSTIDKERYRWVFRLAERMMDIPRNMRAHSSGVVISSEPICHTVPVMFSGAENVRIIQWDKRTAKHFFDKFDVLCLRGNDVLSGTEKAIQAQRPGFDVQKDVPIHDPETYRAMRSGATIGVPQSASPAMRQAHIRLRTQELTDASLVQAGIRPGVGGAVKINELIARRRGKPYTFSDPKLEQILGNTYGIIVFQEQVDQLLQAFAGYSPGEAEEARESIHKRRREGYAAQQKEIIVDRILAQGYAQSVAEEVYAYVSGFEGYGFAQGHALAFAEISVRSIWCQQNFPTEYFAALLNAQPAGYYGPPTLANEARSRGVKVLPPNINISMQSFLAEDVRSEQDPKIFLPSAGLRVGLDQIHGLSSEVKESIVRAREVAPYNDMFDFTARVQPERDELEALILCGALDTLHSNRRAMLWSIPSAQDFAAQYAKLRGSKLGSNQPTLPLLLTSPPLASGILDFNEAEKAIEERRYLDMDIERHLMSYERNRVLEKGGLTTYEVTQLSPDTECFAVGNPIRLRFPPTSSGKRVVFFDLEDETGLLNVTLFDKTYQQYGHALVCHPYVCVVGKTQDRDGHTAFLAERVYPYTPTFAGYPMESSLPIASSDFLVG